MELRQLKYFQLVARFNSITKAAEHLHMAQPAISISIQNLEEEVGVKLFDRSQKQMILTPEGSTLLQRVDDVLCRLQDTLSELNDYNQLHKGSIRIGVPPMLGAFIFPYIFKEFQQSYPYLELTVVENGTLEIQNQLKHGELDVGIITMSEKSIKLNTIPLTTSEICLCLPPNHALKTFSKISFSQLQNQPFILLSEDTFAHQLILTECTKHQFSPRIIFSSSQIETILGLVEQGTGITFLLEDIARKHSNLLVRHLETPLFIQSGLAWNEERYLSKAVKVFIDFIKNSPFHFQENK